MFDLDLSDEQQRIIDLLRTLAAERIRPIAREAEEAAQVPTKIADDRRATGLLAPVAEDLGGQGLPDAVTSVLAAEELGWGDAGVAVAALAIGHTTVLVSWCATEEQRRALLGPFVSGSAVGAVALHEGFGRRPSDLVTAAEPAAQGWRLRGSKVAVPHHDVADLLILVARRTDTQQLGAFVVGRDDPGVTVVRSDAEAGAIALGAARMASMDFDLKCPSAALVGGGESDPVELSRAIALIRLSQAAISLGCARAAVEYAAEYATQREAFGKTISAFQGVAFMVTDAEMELEAARLGIWHAVSSLTDNSTPQVLEDLTNIAVSHCNEMVLRATRTGMQVLGGHGYLTDHPMERWYRSAAALASLDFDPLEVPFPSA